jgi:hypothetical protein
MRSDGIAEALDAGDECEAARRADELKHAVDDAIARGDVPAPLQGELVRVATDLQNEVNCEHEENDKGEKKGHDKGGETTTVETTTMETPTIATTTGDQG